MYKFLKQGIALMLLTTTSILANQAEPTMGDGGNPKPFAYLPPDQWQLPSKPEIRPINLNPESEAKDKEADANLLSKLAQPLPKLTNKEEIINDVLAHYPEIARKVRLLSDPDSRQEFLPRQLLLVGQAGVSKTTIATVLAHVLDRKVIFLQGASLVGDQFQNSGVARIEGTLGEVWREVQKTDDKYIVIIDEFMRIVEDFDKDRGEGKKIATLVWYYLDRLRESGQVFFVATANSVKELPHQVKSRFDNDILKIDVPDQTYRKKILANIIGDCNGMSKKEFDSLGDKTAGFTHRKIEKIVFFAMQLAMDRDNKNPKIKMDDFQQGVKRIEEQDYQTWTEQTRDFFNENSNVIGGTTSIITCGVCFSREGINALKWLFKSQETVHVSQIDWNAIFKGLSGN